MKKHIAILCGGSGTRLWPYSRSNSPKQMLDLSGSGKPVLIESIERIQELGSCTLLGTKELKKTLLGLCSRFEVQAEYFTEPIAKNTAPAIAAFSQNVLNQEDSLIAILPSDHSIQKIPEFHKNLNDAYAEAEKGRIVTIGIQPSFAATSFGYLKCSPRENSQVLSVDQFIEKPNEEKAQELIQEKTTLWNAGIFVFKASVFLKKLQEHAPELYNKISTLKKDLSNTEEIFQTCESVSIDYALMEKLDSISCIASTFSWSDLGSWEQVKEVRNTEKIREVDSSNNAYFSFPKKEKDISFVGTEDLIVVEQSDSLLILKEGSGQKVKEIVNELKKTENPILSRPPYEERPWGNFQVLLDTKYFKSKKIQVLPGKRLSYQSHKHRSEHWIVVKGTATVILNDEEKTVSQGEHIYIPLGAKHRTWNKTDEIIEFIEVQVGDYFGEDDIVRYEDDFGRGE